MKTLKSGFVTFIGLPNAGKSSLLNRMVGEDIAIVTPKAQTTRQTLKGYVVKPGVQLVITDTPGLQEGSKALNLALTRNVARAMGSALEGRELVALVIDAAECSKNLALRRQTGLEALQRILENSCGALPLKLPVYPVLNKADGVSSLDARARVEEYISGILSAAFIEVLPTYWVSARSGTGVEDLQKAFIKRLPEVGEELFHEDELSDQPLREFAAEFVREQCFLKLGEEVPYSIAVQIEEFDERDPNIFRIEAILYVERDSQKAIVIGKGGEKIKTIGVGARERLEKFLGRKVYLGLKVKVAPHWSREAKDVERFGYGSAE